jgi:mannose-6-phosphate isomerase
VAFQPGEIHAYLQGAGIEVAGNSDNVVRAGLTNKHVDSAEFLEKSRFSCQSITPLDLEPRAAGELVYPTRFAEFEVSVLRVTGDQSFTSGALWGPEILVCTQGGGAVSLPDGSDRDAFETGAAFFVRAGADAYRIEGAAELYRARVPSDSSGMSPGG